MHEATVLKLSDYQSDLSDFVVYEWVSQDYPILLRGLFVDYFVVGNNLSWSETIC